MELDAAMSENIFLKEELAGTTAVVVLIKDDVLYCVSIFRNLSFITNVCCGYFRDKFIAALQLLIRNSFLLSSQFWRDIL